MHLFKSLSLIQAISKINLELLDGATKLPIMPNALRHLILCQRQLLPLNITLIIKSPEFDLQILVLVPEVLELRFRIFQLTVEPEWGVTLKVCSSLMQLWLNLELLNLLFEHQVLFF